jgi:uncharacterized protein YndB with AHSA1/START domain
MTEHSRTRQTNAPAERVWEIWSDTSTWSSWNPDVASMEPGRRLELGAETTMHTKAGRHHRMKVVALEPGRGFSLETSPVPLTRFTFTCSIERAPSGSTIRQGVKMSGPLGGLMSAMAGNRVAEGFGPILDGLAGAAEKA